MKLTQEQYREIYAKLPDELKDVAVSGKVNQEIYDICEKHKLHIDEAGKVYNITMDVVMGVVAAKNFERDIVSELKLNLLDASSLVRDIDAQVLAPIKDAMISLYKHSNPFKPQTLQHMDETDEEDESHLDRNNLLAEIENPQKAEVRKESVGSNLPVIQNTVAQIQESETPKIEPKPEPVLNDSLQKTRERVLGMITEEKLSGIVTMQAHTEKIPAPEPKIEVVAVQKPTEPVINLAVQKAPTLPTSPTPPVIEKPSVVVAPQIASVQKTADPYRESI